MNWQERILINPAVRSGKPCVKVPGITVYDVLEYLAGGMSEDEILKDFPDLTRDDIRASFPADEGTSTAADMKNSICNDSLCRGTNLREILSFSTVVSRA